LNASISRIFGEILPNWRVFQFAIRGQFWLQETHLEWVAHEGMRLADCGISHALKE
jgi:hypothetical protein